MFCSECGTKNESGASYCANCGALTGENAQASSEPRSACSGNIAIGPVKINAPDENSAHISILGMKLLAAYFFRVASALLVVGFFMPLFSFQVRIHQRYAINASLNGWTATFGSESARGHLRDGYSWAILLLLIPVGIFVLIQFKSRFVDKFDFIEGKLLTFTSAGFVLGLVVLLLLRINISSMFEDIGFLIGYRLSLIVYLVAGLLSIGCFMSARGMDITISLSNIVSRFQKLERPVQLPKSVRVMFICISVILLALFYYISWVDVMLVGPGAGFSGVDLVFGRTGRSPISPMPSARYLLAIPIVLLALFVLQNIVKLNTKLLLVLSMGLSIAGVVYLASLAQEVDDFPFRQIGSLEMSGGYYLSRFLYVFNAIASLIILVRLGKTTKRTE